jgi:hypothetical protein
LNIRIIVERSHLTIGIIQHGTVQKYNLYSKEIGVV